MSDFNIDLALTDDGEDAETVTVIEAVETIPVDEPDSAAIITWGDVTKSTPNQRPPIIPAWMRSHTQRVQTLKQMGGNVAYYLAFHLVRSPKYATKSVLYAPRGLGRAVHRVGHWAAAEEGNWALRQHAANSNDAQTWMSLDKTRSKEAGARWWLVGLLGVPLLGALLAAWALNLVPSWAWQVAAVVSVLMLARLGQPADKGIIDRVSQGRRFTKLTGEMVREALLALGLAQLREPGAVQFVHPGIHRDGPGWLARVNLPAGLEAVKVLEKRGALSSALRLPVDQVWPSAGPEHAGQLDLWVGYQPASKMRQPAWSLADPKAITSVFEPCVFGTDERMRPVSVGLFANNFLIGGQPGSGKSYAARALTMIAALDPTVELLIAEFKGTGDFMDLGALASTYICGVNDEDLQAGADMIQWVLDECRRRGKRIEQAKKDGLAPEGKVTPELARKPGSGLHPIVVVLDEVHELFGWDDGGKDASKNAERAIKRGRALGIVFILATQIPDKESLPPAITRCVSMRWCLSVADFYANDAILGTGMYKRGITATVYRPKVDAGWGIVTGLERPLSVLSQFPDPETAAAIVARAAALRGEVVASAQGEKVQIRNLLEDTYAVMGGDAGLPWDVLADRLAEQWPEFYRNMTGAALREALKRYDVRSEDVNVRDATGWKKIKGLRRTAIQGALDRQRLEANQQPQLAL